MRNVILVVCACLVCLVVGFSFAPKADRHARVERVQGIHVYVLSEPLDDYEVIFTEKNPSREYSIQGTVDNLISRVRKKQDRNRIGEFDAIIISDGGSKGTLIKFKED